LSCLIDKIPYLKELGVTIVGSINLILRKATIGVHDFEFFLAAPHLRVESVGRKRGVQRNGEIAPR